MDVDLSDGPVVVKLSERNLRDLLSQYEQLGTAELHRMTRDGFLQVWVESDEKHYAGRRPGPGGPFVGPA